MMGYSDLERRTEKKAALESASNVSRSRLSLINTVYRENYKSDYKRRKLKLGGPWEFKSVSRIMCSWTNKDNPLETFESP